jgi:hypothetical protein
MSDLAIDIETGKPFGPLLVPQMKQKPARAFSRWFAAESGSAAQAAGCTMRKTV